MSKPSKKTSSARSKGRSDHRRDSRGSAYEGRSLRSLRKELKVRTREARKLFRRGRRRLSTEVREDISETIAEARAARKDGDRDRVTDALSDLEPVVLDHLAQFRKSAVREYAESIGLAVLFALMLRAFVVEAFQIPSQSMEPTLLVGDHLFVNKFVYGLRIPFTKYDLIRFGEPERGDVVVFIFPVEEVRTEAEMRTVMAHLGSFRIHSDEFGYPESLADIGMEDRVDDWGHPFRYQRLGPADYRLASAGPDGAFDTSDDINNANTALRPGDTTCITSENLAEAKDYIKRVIGVAGDRIRVEDNIVYINDEPVEHETLPDRRDAFNRPMVRAVERLGDAEYVVQYYGAIDDFEEITVRDGYIFVMGDNRDNSSDSRCWGQVPVENVKGEALFIFWSGGSEDGFLGNRWNRMLKGVD